MAESGYTAGCPELAQISKNASNSTLEGLHANRKPRSAHHRVAFEMTERGEQVNGGPEDAAASASPQRRFRMGAATGFAAAVLLAAIGVGAYFDVVPSCD